MFVPLSYFLGGAITFPFLVLPLSKKLICEVLTRNSKEKFIFKGKQQIRQKCFEKKMKKMLPA